MTVVMITRAKLGTYKNQQDGEGARHCLQQVDRSGTGSGRRWRRPSQSCLELSAWNRGDKLGYE